MTTNKPCKLAGCALHNILSYNEPLHNHLHFDDPVAVIFLSHHPAVFGGLIDHRYSQRGAHPSIPPSKSQQPQIKPTTPPTPQDSTRHGDCLQERSNNKRNIYNRTSNSGKNTNQTRKHACICTKHIELNKQPNENKLLKEPKRLNSQGNTKSRRSVPYSHQQKNPHKLQQKEQHHTLTDKKNPRGTQTPPTPMETEKPGISGDPVPALHQTQGYRHRAHGTGTGTGTTTIPPSIPP